MLANKLEEAKNLPVEDEDDEEAKAEKSKWLSCKLTIH